MSPFLRALALDTWSSSAGAGFDRVRRARRWWIDLVAAVLFVLGLVASTYVDDPPPGWLLLLFAAAAVREGVVAGYWYGEAARDPSTGGRRGRSPGPTAGDPG